MIKFEKLDSKLVPPSLIELHDKKPTVVYCNLRPSQRICLEPDAGRDIRGHRMNWGGKLISYPLEAFLSGICEFTQVAVHFTDGNDLLTFIGRLSPHIAWTDGRPVLRFEEPAELDCRRDFLGEAILAIAEVNAPASAVVCDPEAAHFISIVDHYGVARALPRFKSGCVITINHCIVGMFHRGLEVEQLIPDTWHARPGDCFRYIDPNGQEGFAIVVKVEASQNTEVSCRFYKSSLKV